MDNQPSLLDWQPTPKARKRGPETSKAAARRAAAWTSPQCDALLKALCKSLEGMTRADLIEATRIKESSACARLKDMQDGGIVEVRGTRLGPYGSEVQVYHATGKGRARARVLEEMKG